MKDKRSRRLGIVGIRGGLSRAQMTCLHGGIDFVAACDTNAEKRKEAAALGVKTYDNYDRMLTEADIDCIIIATPNDLHCSMVLKAFEKGLDIFCEKPMATNIPDCLRMIEASETAGKMLMAGFCYRHSNLFHKFVHLAHERRVGTPLMLWCKEFRGFWGNMGDAWRLSQDRSGGAIVEKNCHHFDIFNWVAQSRPVRVAAFGGKSVHRESESIDNAVVIVEYENGIRAQLHLCLFLERFDELEIGVLGPTGKIEARILHTDLADIPVEIAAKTSSRGSITLWPIPGTPETITVPPTYCSLWPDGQYQHLGTANQFEAFARCLTTGERSPVDGRIGLDSLLICCAAEKSIRCGRVIETSELY